ncbi:unnamed protein product [Adineta steineri]|uniref:MATH domain-containing protein n=1 Tax=Adineta steineri TaxID=433720 RepID=A0A818RV94_9BILA|nr:unnamed protein product [Adineta steineri]CAF1340150.1 unnamed protein product [Adineta steineri]CAF3599972.1 unnamed protein product [Adineta steineri]CAF3659802.1 unnamed protein product [Adineta steineri]
MTEITKVKDDIQHLNNQLINYYSSFQRLSEECLKIRTNSQEINIIVENIKLKQKREDIRDATSNGSLVWKIENFTQKWNDARSGRQISIESPLFYSLPTGYKMCARLHMYGDADAHGTHMSMFLVLLKGEYDAILTWPFNFRVTFCLFDQTGQGYHIVDSFDPDTTLPSVQRPNSNMNTAGGIPKFCPLAFIEQSENYYVRDDTMFINIKVNFNDELKIPLPYTAQDNPGLPIHIQDTIRLERMKQCQQLQEKHDAEIRCNDREILDRSLIHQSL